jgi:hypothetical protein
MTMIRTYWKLFMTAAIVMYFIACSPHNFSHIEGPACRGSGVACLVTSTGTEKYSDVKTVGNGIVDILVIDDNSGSMSTEQNAMGSKFPTFISSLGQIDWRIGVITTDVSGVAGQIQPAKAANGNGAFRDGRLLKFSNGASYIDKNTASASSLFNGVIKRNETLTCEQSGYQESSCPSSDERGILAANLFLNGYASGFLRPSAPLAIIVLSDEDVRSGLYAGGSRNTNNQPYGYELQTADQPDSLISNFKSLYPNKTLSFHSIVIKNGDSSCLSQQNSQGTNVLGSYGKKYQEASSLTSGVVGSICSADYGNELGQIAYDIQNQVTSMAFVCRPKNDQFTWSASPQPAQTVTATADFDRLVVDFDKPFTPGTKITLEYECDKSN